MPRQVVLICGPPCSGKSTLARQLATTHPGLIVDRDDIAQRLGSPHPWNHPRHITTAAEREMQAQLDYIANTGDITAYVVRSLPDPVDREQLATRLGATVTLLDPGQRECERRARADHRPQWTYGAITNWYKRTQPTDRPTRTPRSKRSTTERGYGYHHRQVRAAVKPHVDAGEATCWRCGNRILPGTPWDLGHDDEDRTRYRGPEHRDCNRSSAAVRGNAMRTVPTNSRNWLE
jgi:predicted kinase